MGSPQVLLVEDDDELAELLAIVLRSEGFGVSVAASGDAAIAAARARPPSVVLIDLTFGDGGADEVLARLRGEARCDPPVIVMSGAGQRLARRFGARRPAQAVRAGGSPRGAPASGPPR